ncbi:flavin reductase (DIM6/NTAB) family NADH-FMN oxidoreductase RutF [Nonomuraea thailandensis]|uniref:Flavin reductase (DIM6/NTAB) family NADH-FMN oxidoreductase RutF n=1 Tax=Nonomuraea thailandensis TaxID=1188745 RepID=A0A9X2JYT5_9ACTN|nr:flavin reductase family protein [Nonomuraea thailandensis]MCP2353469.1 flavin reductase (DIM6/NTAB) family NADH-FMN oxidoreductase RutF [Nonomuraea thailandensis]
MTAATTSTPVDIRPLMAEFPTGVAVVTAFAGRNLPCGMTCTSMCSVTLTPPTVAVCLRAGSPTLDAVVGSREFALNLLHAQAQPTAELFGSGNPDRYNRVPWDTPDGARGPHLVEAAHMIADCVLVGRSDVGDHVIVLGRVARFRRAAATAPLLYGRRRYASWPD